LVTLFALKQPSPTLFKSLVSRLVKKLAQVPSPLASLKEISIGLYKSAAGRAGKNFGLVLPGKELVPGIKPNRTLAVLPEAPLSSKLRWLYLPLGHVNKALAKVGFVYSKRALLLSELV
jgi:hypothetical protein